jgi:hypothetical protein
MKVYPACKITFFEIPPYSIIDFNAHRQNSDPASFKKQEEELPPPLFLNFLLGWYM